MPSGDYGLVAIVIPYGWMSRILPFTVVLTREKLDGAPCARLLQGTVVSDPSRFNFDKLKGIRGLGVGDTRFVLWQPNASVYRGAFRSSICIFMATKTSRRHSGVLLASWPF